MKYINCDRFKQRMMFGKVANLNVGKDAELRSRNKMFVLVGNGLNSSEAFCTSSRKHQNVQRFQTLLLVVWHKREIVEELRLNIKFHYVNCILWKFQNVVVDLLTKLAHFLHVNTTYSLEKLAELNIVEIVRLHGIPSSIVFDRDPRFTSRSLRTKLQFSIAFHPQIDSQSDRVIQVLEDMLRSCVIEFRIN
ncbi:DNA/RNA polymerases superfamily protein [Gossypium australe]|uniref:DNA/RNA polymerases superfamily protein n=1 Tax=Gossypium australe TaxID=47621 RepID=A0A5B6UZQ0_9ROSI|nr:DNA/RNA polymerases superfamily protein [Gossypium australe]